MIKLLILSYPVWNERNNSVNTYQNLFGNEKEYEIANIAILPGNPYGTVCKRFFLLSESMLFKHIIRGGTVGKELFQLETKGSVSTKQNSRFVCWLKKYRFEILFWLRELVWKGNCWKSDSLVQFVKDFAPDIIVLPIKDVVFFNRLGLYVQEISDKPLVCFVTDDVYTFKHFSWSPLFWLRRLRVRPVLKNTIKCCAILYTLTEKQKKEYDRIFGVNCRVVTKAGDFTRPVEMNNEVHETIRLVYTGNIGSGRWHTLALIGDSLVGQNAELVIYSGTPLKSSQLKRVLKSGKVKMMGLIPQNQVKTVQEEGDILVHVESFDLSERYSARLSFSTKIVDYLELGKCILAVGWKNTAAIEYLQEKDAAFVITNKRDIPNRIHELLNDKDLIFQYANKGYRCGKLYHNKDVINESLLRDLKELAKK